jgi:hypothetical protein
MIMFPLIHVTPVNGQEQTMRVTRHLNLSTDINTLRLCKNELVFVSTPYTSDGFALIRTADNTRTMCPTIYLTACDQITLV